MIYGAGGTSRDADSSGQIEGLSVQPTVTPNLVSDAGGTAELQTGGLPVQSLVTPHMNYGAGGTAEMQTAVDQTGGLLV